MKQQHYLLTSLVVLTLSANAFSSPSDTVQNYFCVSDTGVGFYFDKKDQTWTKTSFAESALSKFLVAPEGKAKDGRNLYKVTEVGSSWPTAKSCYFDEFSQLTCMINYFHSSFTMSKSTYRFISTYAGGYPRGGNDDAIMSIGKCSPM
ncbi:hypothetical protein [Spongorhabdus nitratireducens]